MRISILPKTSLGWWSVSLTVAFILFFALFRILVASGLRKWVFSPAPFINWDLLIYAAFISSMASLVTGLIIIKSKEWSILIFLATLIGLLVLFYVLVVILFARGT